MKKIIRRLRGAFGTAVVWAVGWAGVSVVVSSLLHLLGLGPGVSFWRFAAVVAQNFAGVGFLSGGAFSLFLGVAGRNKRLDELNAGLFGLGGAVTAGLFLPVFTLVVNGLGGVPFSLAATAIISGIAATLAGATAYGTIKIAQTGSRQLGGSVGALGSGQEEG